MNKSNANHHLKESITKKLCIRFLDEVELQVFVDNQQTKGSDKQKRALMIADKIKQAGHGRRKLGLLPQNWEAVLDEFDQNFPNLHELTELLRDHFALSCMGDGRVSWPAVLLVGPAGIGKTTAARWLAEKFMLSFQIFDMASMPTFPLAKSDNFWHDAEPGPLFELLAYEKLANPVVMLNKLDRVIYSEPLYIPLLALDNLLDPRSAKKFVDLSIHELHFNARHVNWILTANELKSIPKPLLSRMRVLNIESPTPEQTKAIAQSIYKTLCREANLCSDFAEQLDDQVLSRLQSLSPRSVRVVIQQALREAARDGRTFVQKQDIKLPK